MLGLVLLTVLVGGSFAADDDVCFAHVESKCSEPGETWAMGGCSSIHGGYNGNANNLHRIIVDDFTDSMNYLLMASSFNTDVVNKMGFHKYFMEKSDSMWNRGKDMMKYVLKRGGAMGHGFQIPPIGSSNSLSSLDFSNEMKSLGITLDSLKARAEDSRVAYMHSQRRTDPTSSDSSFDPTTSHLLEELTESYSGEIRETAEKLNTLGRMIKKDNSRNMAIHLFDKMLEG